MKLSHYFFRVLPVVAIILHSTVVDSFAQPSGKTLPATKKISAAGKPQGDLSKLIRQLDDKSYTVRRQAELSLSQRGLEAIAPLVRATRTGSPELCVRAMSILEHIYINPKSDEKTVDKVEDALEALRDSRIARVNARAAAVLLRNSDMAEKRALAAILRLGGIVRYYDTTQFAQPNRRFILPNGPGGVVLPRNGQPAPKVISYVLLGDKWKGGDAGLKYLKRIPGLRNLYVAQNKKFQPATAKALSSLESSIPNLAIQYRGLSCLGVRGAISNVNGAAVGCQVTSVEKGSAADKGTVKAYDQITHFGNKPVDNFQTLVKLIANHSPGETVQIDVLRRGKKLSLKVVLQGWKK